MIASTYKIILSPFQGLRYLFCYSIPLHGMFGYPALSGLIAPKGRDNITMGAVHREEDAQPAKAPKGRNKL